jgi:hypothetical protein
MIFPTFSLELVQPRQSMVDDFAGLVHWRIRLSEIPPKVRLVGGQLT